MKNMKFLWILFGRMLCSKSLGWTDPDWSQAYFRPTLMHADVSDSVEFLTLAIHVFKMLFYISPF